MRYLILLTILLAGCTIKLKHEVEFKKPPVQVTIPVTIPVNIPPHLRNVPPVDLPIQRRHRNYGGGSCLHAAFQDVLLWQGMQQQADQWRKSYGGGANAPDIERLANGMGIRTARVANGDPAWMDWASRTRRGAAIHWQGGIHAITFLGYDADGRAVLSDNNSPEREQRMPREQFLNEWRRAGGAAITALGQPGPPRPWM